MLSHERSGKVKDVLASVVGLRLNIFHSKFIWRIYHDNDSEITYTCRYTIDLYSSLDVYSSIDLYSSIGLYSSINLYSSIVRSREIQESKRCSRFRGWT